MALSNFQQLKQSPFGSNSLSTQPAKRVGGVRRRDETQDQMSQRLYGGQGHGVATEDLNVIFPGPTQEQQMGMPQMEDPNTNMLFGDAMMNSGMANDQSNDSTGMSDFQQLKNSTFGSNSLATQPRRRAGGVRKRGETQEQMQQRLGQYGNPVNF